MVTLTLRVVLGFACAVALSGSLSACGSQSFSGENESGADLGLSVPAPQTPYVYGVGNTGKPVQQLLLRVDTHGTLDIHSLTAVMGVDTTIINVDLSQGAVYVPQHPIRPHLIRHTGFTWVWNLGDLPSGYHTTAWFKARKLRAVPRQGHVVDLMWYAALSGSQPPHTWKPLTGVYSNVG